VDEVKLLREDMDKRFEFVNRQFETYSQDTDRRIDLLHDEMNKRFEQIDKRFEQIDKRFEQVDKRFEQVDKRFEQIDKRIELLHEEMNKRFELVDKRFELVDKRFEQIDKRFEQIDKRFEQVDKRFEEQHRDILDTKRRVIKLESSVDRLDKKMNRFDTRLNILAGTLGTEKGQRLEEVFATVLSYGLKNPDIKPESIQLRQQFIDTEGLVFPKKGKFIEVDIIAENGKMTVFEVKATATIDDVEIFFMKVKLIQLQNPDKQVHGIIISPWASEEVKQCCTEYDIVHKTIDNFRGSSFFN
jgi:hypothetical protein